MANELPEVVPDVQSMPTTGWFCQTSGNARRRISKNISGTDAEGVYDVAGIPGHTHNASAMISVTADYTRKRTIALTISQDWAEEDVVLAVDEYVDSIEPDDATELYDRAIERASARLLSSRRTASTASGSPLGASPKSGR